MEKGYQIKRSKKPFQVFSAITSVKSTEAFHLIEEAVQGLLANKPPHCKGQFISWLFLVQKKDDSVIDLKPLTGFVRGDTSR